VECGVWRVVDVKCEANLIDIEPQRSREIAHRQRVTSTESFITPVLVVFIATPRLRSPARRDYTSFAHFSDPDGNSWVLRPPQLAASFFQADVACCMDRPCVASRK